jgi:phosphonate transport system permease protein
VIRPRLRSAAVVGILGLVYAFCLWVVAPDMPRLLTGLPRLLRWLATGFPPDFSGPWDLALRASETFAIATLGTTVAAVLALPMVLFAARPVAPAPWLYHPMRAVLDTLRGIDALVFALIFVAAVGLGPFAGMIGISLHSAGTIAKLWSEALETADLGPVEAAVSAGGSRAQAFSFVLLPQTLPQTASALLYVWEFNIRASTVLGVVGAGGLGQDLKNGIDLLDFGRVLADLIIIVTMVVAVDRLSAWLRRRLL